MKRVVIYVTEEVYDFLVARAKKRGRSLSGQVTSILYPLLKKRNIAQEDVTSRREKREKAQERAPNEMPMEEVRSRVIKKAVIEDDEYDENWSD